MTLILARALFAEGPVDGDALLHLGDQLCRDELEFVVAHRLHSAAVGGKGIVEGDLVVCQAKVLSALSGGVEVFSEFDQLFDDLHRADGAVVVGVESLFELLGKDLALHEVTLGAHLEFVLEQLLQ